MTFTEGNGDPDVSISDGINSYPDVYIGTFNVTLSGSLNGTFVGFCDDFTDSINPAIVYTTTSNSTTRTDVNTYLTGSAPALPLTTTQVDEIIGLAFHGVSNVNTLTGDQEAAIQEAIWDIQQEAESNSPAGLATSADLLIGATADGYYNDF